MKHTFVRASQISYANNSYCAEINEPDFNDDNDNNKIEDYIYISGSTFECLAECCAPHTNSRTHCSDGTSRCRCVCVYACGSDSAYVS